MKIFSCSISHGVFVLGICLTAVQKSRGNAHTDPNITCRECSGPSGKTYGYYISSVSRGLNQENSHDQEF